MKLEVSTKVLVINVPSFLDYLIGKVGTIVEKANNDSQYRVKFHFPVSDYETCYLYSYEVVPIIGFMKDLYEV